MWIKDLEKYDENLTLAEFKQVIKHKEEAIKNKEEETFSSIKNEFKNICLKRFYKCPIYGKTLEVYHIEELTHKERTDQWSLIYTVVGTKLSFSRRDVNYRSLINEKFSEKDLRAMEVICELEHKSYMSKYDKISKQLEKLIS